MTKGGPKSALYLQFGDSIPLVRTRDSRALIFLCRHRHAIGDHFFSFSFFLSDRWPHWWRAYGQTFDGMHAVPSTSLRNVHMSCAIICGERSDGSVRSFRPAVMRREWLCIQWLLWTLYRMHGGQSYTFVSLSIVPFHTRLLACANHAMNGLLCPDKCCLLNVYSEASRVRTANGDGTTEWNKDLTSHIHDYSVQFSLIFNLLQPNLPLRIRKLWMLVTGGLFLFKKDIFAVAAILQVSHASPSSFVR